VLPAAAQHLPAVRAEQALPVAALDLHMGRGGVKAHTAAGASARRTGFAGAAALPLTATCGPAWAALPAMPAGCLLDPSLCRHGALPAAAHRASRRD
jgi:hypothetical protein